MPRIRTILHPTDLSDGSAPAFAYACDLARDNGARLVALHVLEPIAPLMADGVILPVDMGPIRAEVREQLHALRPADRAIQYERLLRDGPPAGTIAEVADEVGANLIVMGTHGRGGLSRLLMGSVAEHVLRKTKCPVLFVKAAQSTADEVTARRAADELAGA